MSVNNRARNSKRTIEIIRIELEQAEALFSSRIDPPEILRHDRFEGEFCVVDIFGTPEEYHALMKLADEIDAHLHFRWKRWDEAAGPLAQKLNFS